MNTATNATVTYKSIEPTNWICCIYFFSYDWRLLHNTQDFCTTCEIKAKNVLSWQQGWHLHKVTKRLNASVI